MLGQYPTIMDAKTTLLTKLPLYDQHNRSDSTGAFANVAEVYPAGSVGGKEIKPRLPHRRGRGFCHPSKGDIDMMRQMNRSKQAIAPKRQ